MFMIPGSTPGPHYEFQLPRMADTDNKDIKKHCLQ